MPYTTAGLRATRCAERTVEPQHCGVFLAPMMESLIGSSHFWWMSPRIVAKTRPNQDPCVKITLK